MSSENVIRKKLLISRADFFKWNRKLTRIFPCIINDLIKLLSILFFEFIEIVLIGKK